MILIWSSSFTHSRKVLGSVVEDAAALWPIALHSGDSEVGVSRHEEEVVVNKLLAHLLVHPSQRVVGAGKVPGQLGQGVLHQALNCQPLLLGDTRGETNPSMERPTLMRVEWTGTPSFTLPLIFSGSMSEVCLAVAEMPWYSWMMASNTSAKSL